MISKSQKHHLFWHRENTLAHIVYLIVGDEHPGNTYWTMQVLRYKSCGKKRNRDGEVRDVEGDQDD